MIIDFIKRSWPNLFETDVRKVNESDLSGVVVAFSKAIRAISSE